MLLLLLLLQIEAGQVTRWAGPVEILHSGGQRAELTSPAKIVAGDILLTGKGGRLRAQLDERSIISLGQMARLCIQGHDAKVQQTRLELSAGRMRVEAARPRLPGRSLEIRTNTATVTVIRPRVRRRSWCKRGMYSPLATRIPRSQGQARQTRKNTCERGPEACRGWPAASAEITVRKRDKAQPADIPASATVTELIAEARRNPLRWLIPGVLLEGGTHVLHGKEEAFKTMLTLQMHEALANGGQFLMREVSGGIATGIVELEEKPRLFGHRLSNFFPAGAPDIHILPDALRSKVLNGRTAKERIEVIVRWAEVESLSVVMGRFSK